MSMADGALVDKSSATVTLNTGAEFPMIGIGAWAGESAQDKFAARDWLLTALKAGYRHIDTALFYQTEESAAVAMAASGLAREEVFITTKFPMFAHGRVEGCLAQSLKNLQTDYVDMYLMHWPQSVLGLDPRVTFRDSYAAMEALLAAGKCRAIGVSNFSVKTLEELAKTSKVTPAINQVEMHPYLTQTPLLEYCKSKGIRVVAYTPTGKDAVRADPVILALADKYRASPTQVILGWHVARGVAVLPKSVNGGRQRENLVLPTLSAEDVQRISALDRNDRISSKEFVVDGKLFGWTFEELGWEPAPAVEI